MAWSAMNELTAGDLVTEADMDAIRGNIEYLLTPNSEVIKRDNSGNYTTSSTSWVDVDATNLKITLTTNGGHVLVTFTAAVLNDTTIQDVYLDLDVDATRFSTADNGLAVAVDSVALEQTLAFAVLVEGLAAGSHDFKIVWKVQANNGSMLSNETASLMPMFCAVEV